MNVEEPTLEDHKARSRFIQKLVQKPVNSNIKLSSVDSKKTPMTIVQFWDRLDYLPHMMCKSVSILLPWLLFALHDGGLPQDLSYKTFCGYALRNP